MKTYTVILLYPDYATDDFGADIYVECAQGRDAYEAASAVQKKAEASNIDTEDGTTLIPADDFRPIAVLEGDHFLELDATSFP